MLKVVFLQSGLVAVLVVISAGLAGAQGAMSTLIGGIAYILPNLFFGIRLRSFTGQTSARAFLVGELFKVAGTIGILVVAVRFYEVHWVCMLVGLFAALNANFLALLLKN